MVIKVIAVGSLQVNCYVVVDEISKKAMVVDPGDEPDRIMDIIKDNAVSVEYIVCTHGHFDHVGAVSDLKKETGAGKVIVHADELEIYSAAKDMATLWGYELDPLPDPDILVKEADILKVGEMDFKVIHTPGHSPGGICLYGNGIVVSGDTLFAGSVGRTDLYGGNMSKLKESFSRLMELPENTRVLPGHGPETTIGYEKAENMFSEEFLL